MCSGLTEAAGGTATQKVFSCSPTATGTIPVVVQSNNGSVLFEKSLIVPLPQVSLKTSMGDMLLELDPNKAPITVNNFLQYVWSNFYTNLIFHRVVPGFVIQGGGFNSAGQAATTRDPIKLEVPNGLSNLRGTVAMARTSALNSATSQFYINTVDNVALDTTGGGYAVFGKVVNGLPVVDAISAVQTSNSWPATPVVITSATQTQ
ncbi:MAG: peptidylprolyl isomerase [Rhodoferax sp.]|nr:peptidylprolyl isomerase [Rhodoferax sp.]